MAVRDNLGRTIDYVRISITDLCNLRCVYCMPEEGVEKLSHSDILSYEEILRVARVLAGLGIRHIKVTGGEPLVRRGAAGLVAGLKAIEGIDSVTMTTNGILLADCARDLARAGLDGVNISLDTLDPAEYRAITRRGDLDQALAGLDGALAAGIPSVKVNCVAARGLSEKGIADVALLARDRPIQVRFIEMMPMGLGAEYDRIPEAGVRRILEERFGPMTPWEQPMGNGPAVYASLPGFAGRIGFISAVGSCFCETCNRVRLTSDGMLKPCLHSDDGISLLPALGREDDGLLREQLAQVIRTKPERHRFHTGAQGVERRIMSQIGG